MIIERKELCYLKRPEGYAKKFLKKAMRGGEHVPQPLGAVAGGKRSKRRGNWQKFLATGRKHWKPEEIGLIAIATRMVWAARNN